MEKLNLTASDMLDQVFDDNSDFSVPDSDGEIGGDVYAYREPTLNASSLGEEALLEDIVTSKHFI